MGWLSLELILGSSGFSMGLSREAFCRISVLARSLVFCTYKGCDPEFGALAEGTPLPITRICVVLERAGWVKGGVAGELQLAYP